MGVSQQVLIEEAHRIFDEPLNARGYTFEAYISVEMEEHEPARWDFSFVKPPPNPDPVSYKLEFLFSGFSDADLFDLTVDLYRSKSPSEGKPALGVRLSAYFLERLEDLGHGWHFVNIDQLHAAYTDILDRLLRYGIPLLEDPNTDWEGWHGHKVVPYGDGYAIWNPATRKPQFLPPPSKQTPNS